MRAFFGALRLFVFLLSCGVTIVIQSTIFLFTRGPFAYLYPRAYHAFVTKLLKIKVIVEGQPVGGRNIAYISNHVSYMDIQVLGSVVHGAFVAKKDVEKWPIFGLVGKMGQTLYISRDPKDAPRETALMAERLDIGAPLIIFAEGTSSGGDSVLPFKSSLFQIFLNRNMIIQPVTITIIEADGRPAIDQTTRDVYAWHGDMTFEPHLWRYIKTKGAIIKVTFHKPLLTLEYHDRKQLSADANTLVAEGLALSATRS